jgi:hypothetical protein
VPQVAVAAERPRRDRRGRAAFEAWVLVAGAIAIVLAGALVVRAMARPRPVAAHGWATSAAATSKKKGKANVGAAATAVFAHMKGHDVELHYPAVPDEMVAVGFHQAWNMKATDMVPVSAPHPRDKYAATKAALAADPSLKMFLMTSRGRGSSEYSAADCAVKPGSIILAPVTGVVAVVKTYKLAGYGTDYQIQIKPDGAPGLRVVMIHIKDVTVKPGDMVEGGVTPVATVRHLPGDNQVNRYLPVPADHTHVQVNDAGYKLDVTS